MPDANYDYQVTWRDVTFASRLIDQGQYIWEFDDGTDTLMGTDVEHHYYNDGDYDVSLIVASPYDCIDTVTKTVTINSVGIDDIGTSLINVYPNPNNGVFTISLVNAKEEVHITIYDSEGRVVLENSLDVVKSAYVIDVSNKDLADGVYVLKANQGTSTSIHRLIIR
jgi:PKD repeat protein